MPKPQRRAPIYRNRIYEAWIPQGTSGFPAAPIKGIVLGEKLSRGPRRSATNLCDIIGDGRTVESAVWRWDDGHIPTCQPRGTREQAEEYLRQNPYSYAVPAKETTP